jgi:hypothetical protein
MFIPLGTLGNVFTTIIDTFDRSSLGTTTTTGHKLTQLRQSWSIQSSNYVISSAAANTYPLLTIDVEQTDQVSGTYTSRYLGNGPAFWVTDANNWWAVISNMRVALDRTPVTTCSGSGCPPCGSTTTYTTYYTCGPCPNTTTANSCYYCSAGYTLIGTDCYFYDVLDQQYYYNGSAYYGPNASACGTTTTCTAPCTLSSTVCNSPCGCSTSYTEYSYYTEIKVLQCVAGTVSTYSTDIIVNATSYDIANVPNYISVVTRDNQITIRPFNNSNVLMGSAIVKNISSPTKGNYAGIAYGGSEYNQNGALSLYYNAGRPTS